MIWRLVRRSALAGVAVMTGLWLTAAMAVAATPTTTGPTITTNCGASGCLGGIGVVLTGPGAGPGNTSYASVNVPPPLCWYAAPTMTEKAMYDFVHNQWPKEQPPILFTDWSAIQTQVNALNTQAGGNPPGLWYQLNANTTITSPAEQKCLYGDASFLWVPAGTPVTQPAVAPKTLALFALKRLTLPKPKVTLNPVANKSVVNLPTFVKIGAPAGAANGQIYVTATIPAAQGFPNGESVTVAVTEKSVGISPGASGTAYTGGCGPTGSKETAAQMNAAGVGATPDCGVLYQQPSGATPFTLSVTQTWMATAYLGPFAPGQQGNLLPVAQRGPLQSPASVLQVLVKEIQSVNG